MREKSSKSKIASFHRAARAALRPLADPRRAAGMRAYTAEINLSSQG